MMPSGSIESFTMKGHQSSFGNKAKYSVTTFITTEISELIPKCNLHSHKRTDTHLNVYNI